MFEIGEKVVCVDDKFEGWVRKLYTALPRAGATYVIRDVRLGVAHRRGKREGAASVLLVGLVNPTADSKAALERGFNAERFRPLDEMKQRRLERTGIGIVWEGKTAGEGVVEKK